jgi:citronellol/citronellal dehydrogenase
MDLKDKTLFITGGTRGIGLAIAQRAARDGARVAVFGKTDQPHPRLPGTVHSAAAEITRAGGQALPLAGDVRSEASVLDAVARTVDAFGGIDILVNNASAIALGSVEATDLRRFDLLGQVNARGTFLASKACLPHLRRAPNPHILTLAPPPAFDPRWFRGCLAYAMAKFGMSLCALGLAEELRAEGIASNTLWPLTTIATAAVRNLLGGEALVARSRTPAIVADAAWAILGRSSRACTGNSFIDEEVLREEGVEDFTSYAVDPSMPLAADLFLPEAVLRRTPTPILPPFSE